jgi:hypothetical protein
LIEKTSFMGFDAVRLSNGKKDELIVVTEVGPRVISFCPEGKDNFFYVNEGELSSDVRGSENWHLYGGTRLWISPETGLTYTPDNVPSEIQIQKDTLAVVSPVDEKTMLRKTIMIEPHGDSFMITYGIRNEGKHLFTAGLWAISCVKPLPGAQIYLPWGTASRWDVKDMKYWRSWLDVGSNIESNQWKPTNEFFIVRPTGEIGKVGFANNWSFAVYRAGALSFVKKTNYIDAASYPDGGCSYEIYTSKEFYEIETLSPLYTIKPGFSFTHREEWWAGYREFDLSSIKKAHGIIQTLVT